jgi:hypothetical protein
MRRDDCLKAHFSRGSRQTVGEIKMMIARRSQRMIDQI